MEIEGSVVLVTGANRGLGRALTAAFLGAGAAKVYAGARDVATISDERLVKLQLDVTSHHDVTLAAQRCTDANLLINNAGVMLMSSILGHDAESAMRREMDVNLFGSLAMSRAFTSILAANGGGAIVNILSVVSWFTSPFNATYCASKHAALAMTDALRIELKTQNTLVTGVYAGLIDTDMIAHVDQPKTSPQVVAESTLRGLLAGKEQVFADDRAAKVWLDVRNEPARLAEQMQERWNKTRSRH